MSQKIDIIKYIIKQEDLDLDRASVRRALNQWWQNPRPKSKGGLRLTEEGFNKLTKHFKVHQVRFENRLDDLKFSNQLILRLDNFITCPWYINKVGIWVFDDKMAVQLVLFSGNIVKFTAAKARSLDKQAH